MNFGFRQGCLIFFIVLSGPGAATPVLAKENLTLHQVLERKLVPPLIAPPQDQEVCFSPGEPCREKLKKFIESAQTTLDIAIYDINLDEVVHSILLQAKKIAVRIVVDKRQAKGSHSLVNLLIKSGINTRWGRQRGIMHNKFTIVDKKAIELGSFNYTNHAATANRENQLYLWTASVVDRYVKEFEEIWNSAVPAKLE